MLYLQIYETSGLIDRFITWPFIIRTIDLTTHIATITKWYFGIKMIKEFLSLFNIITIKAGKWQAYSCSNSINIIVLTIMIMQNMFFLKHI